MMVKLLGSASELMEAEVISKREKKVIASPVPKLASAGGIGVDIQKKIRPRRLLQFMGADQYGCSYAPVFLNVIRLANPLLK